MIQKNHEKGREDLNRKACQYLAIATRKTDDEDPVGLACGANQDCTHERNLVLGANALRFSWPLYTAVVCTFGYLRSVLSLSISFYLITDRWILTIVMPTCIYLVEYAGGTTFVNMYQPYVLRLILVQWTVYNICKSCTPHKKIKNDVLKKMV